MLKAVNLYKEYTVKKGQSVKALNGVTLTFPDRGMVFVLGKSGSGKSTLLNVLGGLDDPDSGRIEIFDLVKEFGRQGDEAVKTEKKKFKERDYNSYRNKYVGFVFQDYNVFNTLTVRGNVNLAIELQAKKPDPKLTADILAKTGLTELADRYPNQLSGGQRQRIAIARALVKNPRVILADEPTGALDTNSSKEIFSLLKEMSKTCLVVCVTHDARSAEEYADRIVRLKDGKVVRDCTRIAEDQQQSLSSTGNLKQVSKGLIKICHADSFDAEDAAVLEKRMKEGKSESVYISYGDKVVVPPELIAGTAEDSIPYGFKETTEEDIKAFSDMPTKFESFKAHLCTKMRIYMGLTSLLHGPFRLAITVVISLLAFTILGLSSTMTLFNPADSFAQTADIYNPTSQTFYEKTFFVDPDEDSRRESPRFSLVDYENISNETGGNAIPTYNTSFVNFSMDVPSDTLNGDYSRDVYPLNCLSSAVVPTGFTSSTFSEAYGYEVIGEMPDGFGEVMLPDYFMYMFQAYGGMKYFELENDTVVEKGLVDADSLGDESKWSSQVLGKKIYLNNPHSREALATRNEQSSNKGLFEIVGILDTHFNYEDAASAVSQSDGFKKELTWARLYRDEFDYGPWRMPFFAQDCFDAIDSETFKLLQYASDSSIPNSSQYEYYNPIATIVVPGNGYDNLYRNFEITQKVYSGTPDDRQDNDHLKAYLLNSVITTDFLTDGFQSNLDSISNLCLDLSIVMGVISILITMNFIFTSVAFRKQDIGILKGLGATSHDVFSIFLFEAVIIGLLNFALSIALTAGLTTALNSFLMSALGTPLNLINFSWVQVLILFVVALAVAVVSAIFPSYHIASMKPVKAMKRDE